VTYLPEPNDERFWVGLSRNEQAILSRPLAGRGVAARQRSEGDQLRAPRRDELRTDHKAWHLEIIQLDG